MYIHLLSLLTDGFGTDDKCDSIHKVFKGLTVEGILKSWSRIKPMIVKDWSENIDARFHLFGKVRDEWIDKDLFDYLDWC